MWRQFAAGVAQGVGPAVDLARSDVERRVAERMVPMRLMQTPPLPCSFVSSEAGAQAGKGPLRHGGNVLCRAVWEVIE